MGCVDSRARPRSPRTCRGVPGPDGGCRACVGRCDRRRDRPAMSVEGLTGVTLERTPDVCHGCVWWQSRSGRHVDKRKWIEKAETEWGPWGTVYFDNDGELLGSMQYGPAHLFPRAAELPAGPP